MAARPCAGAICVYIKICIPTAAAAVLRAPRRTHYTTPMAFAPGQRWISTAEPELGLGTVLRVEGRTVQLAFPASGVVRQYAAQMAPLTRAEFRPGERVSGAGQSFVVERVDRNGGVLTYFGSGGRLSEGELDDVQNVSKADARLMAGRV